MDEDAGDLPLGPIVKLRVDGECLLVLIEPALPSGNQHPQYFARRDRDFAWQYAKTLWAYWGLGFIDETDGNCGRSGPNRRTIEKLLSYLNRLSVLERRKENNCEYEYFNDRPCS